VHRPTAKNLHLLTLLRDWAVEAARPFDSPEVRLENYPKPPRRA
jgi:hypothetical protein